MMKLSLWQQFSSNHSATFLVVGQFETTEWAEMVETEIQSILREFSDWWAHIPEDDRHAHWETLQQANQLTPPEQTIQQRYQIANWRRGAQVPLLDWILYHDASEAVHRIGALVTINQRALQMDTWSGPAPFDEILQKLGGAVYVSCAEVDRDFSVTIRGTADNPEAAQTIVSWVTVMEHHPRKSLHIPGHYPTPGVISSEGSHVVLQGCWIAAAYYGTIAKQDVRSHHQVVKREKDKTSVWIKSTFENDLQYLLHAFEEQGLHNITYTFEETNP